MKQGFLIEKIKKVLLIFEIVTFCFLFSSIGSEHTISLAATIGGEMDVTNQRCTIYEGNNVNQQNYTVWTSTIQSYLTPLEDGMLMRVQAADTLPYILVEYYNENYQLISTKTIPEELPIFGGFFVTDSHYYVVTGQSNMEESSLVEVFRITKYDKQWNRIASAGLSDCNTTVPFEAGSCRMDISGKYLFIRTAHKMYKDPEDGLRHQANATIQVDTETMKVTDSYTDVMNMSIGYVSHSFNQFVKIENNNMITVDHGDAHPRGIVLLKYHTDVSTGKFVPQYSDPECDAIPILLFPGGYGQNVTGASVGGFEISNTHYLVAGNSVVQDEQNVTRHTRNIFVAGVDKNSSQVQMNWLTSFSENEQTTSTPHMVPISKNQYMVLWSSGEKVYYTLVDNTGKVCTKTYEMDAQLSDCVPIVSKRKVTWYTWDDDVVTFYGISLQDLSMTEKYGYVTGHENEFFVANPISLETAVEGTISQDDCYDMWKFTLTKKEDLEIFVSRLGVFGINYYSLHLYDENKNLVMVSLNNDLDEGNGYRSRTHNVTLEPGTYYLKIDGFEYLSSEPLRNHIYSADYQLKLQCKTSQQNTDQIGQTNTGQTGETGQTNTGQTGEMGQTNTGQTGENGQQKPPVTTCTHTYQKKMKKASMKKKGSITEKCSKCGKVKKTTTIPAPTKISLSAYTHTYSGKARKPSVTIYDSIGRKLSKKRSYSVSYKHNKYVGKAMITITFKGNYSGKVVKRFPIIPKPTTIQNLQGGEKSFTISWAKINSQVSGYQIQYSTSKKFPKKQMKIVTIESNHIFSKTLSTVKSSTYYVRVRTFKRAGSGTYYSKWSKVKVVKT